jgi:hypothetical protein
LISNGKPIGGFMRYVISLVVIVYSLSASMYGQEKGQGAAHSDHQNHSATKAVDVPKPSHQPKADHQPKAPKPEKAARPVKLAKPAEAPKPAKAPKPASNSRSRSTSNTTTTTRTVVASVTTTTPTTDFVKNAKLQKRLAHLLPGGDMNEAAKGFKNWGQFVAAVHAANNLNIPFYELKTRMTGTNAASLGQAIQSVRALNTTTGTTPATGTTPTTGPSTYTSTTTSTTTKTTTVTQQVRTAEQQAAEDFRLSL